MSDFPDVVEIFSTNSSGHYPSSVVESFGRYVKIEGETSNGKPVWKHESNDRGLHSDEGNWCFGTTTAPANKKCGYISSDHKNKDLDNSGVWHYYDKNNIWQDDSTIIVKGYASVTAGRKDTVVEEEDQTTVTCRTTKNG